MTSWVWRISGLLLILQLMGCSTTPSIEEPIDDQSTATEMEAEGEMEAPEVEELRIPDDSSIDFQAELGYDISLKMHDCPFEVPSWLEGECGTLTVPEDRTKPEGNVVKFPFVIFRSTHPDPEPDPVIYLTGGGGGNELDNIQRYSSVIVDVIQDRDYIMYNQRGAKYGEPYLMCPGILEFDSELVQLNLSIEEQDEERLAFFQACSEGFRSAGIDLNQYNSAVNAADLNDLRLALGYEKINIYGTSYGTRLGLAVLRDFPEILRSAILDSVYPPQIEFFSDYGLNIYRAFGRVFEACEADAKCGRSYPELEAVFVQTVEKLNIKPGSVEYKGQTLRFDGGDFMEAINQFPKSHYAELLPVAIYQASEGEYAYFESIIPYVLGVVPSDAIAGGVQKSMFCREELPYESFDGLRERNETIPAPYTYTFETDFYWRLCEIWGVEPADPYVNEPVFSEVPTLILEGLYDTVTPIEYGRLVAETLSNSYYYEFPGGHGIMRTFDCGRNIGLQFLENPWEEPDSSCIERMKPPDFE